MSLLLLFQGGGDQVAVAAASTPGRRGLLLLGYGGLVRLLTGMVR